MARGNPCPATDEGLPSSRVTVDILRFELSLLLHLTPTLSAPLTFCKFAKKWGRFHLKQCYTKMTASMRRSFWYLMILTSNAVHNPLESIEGKGLQFYDFHKFFVKKIKRNISGLRSNFWTKKDTILQKVPKWRLRSFATLLFGFKTTTNFFIWDN